ncbi:hypothetical protein [Streptomyces himalayensis]|uniref:Uncharacterized protein n=1 Tax=Streptomyces himalayensis subsp. himalayensis TaxID=2756131 RepID=A0A7W0IAZ9_9ACTN|nr:hypothetical protein [Streptomyces himalayensis subsp. himalayensis]
MGVDRPVPDGRAGSAGGIGGGSLEVSYDDGATWTAVDLERDGEKAAWQGLLKVPDSAEFVSLRASVSDDRGGSVTQEIIRAVGVR